MVWNSGDGREIGKLIASIQPESPEIPAASLLPEEIRRLQRESPEFALEYPAFPKKPLAVPSFFMLLVR
jgi:hypothetical protein